MPYSELKGRRILILLGSLELGGTERQAVYLAQWLKTELRADVQVWGFSSPGKAAEICSQEGIPWRSLSRPWWSGKIQKITSLVDLARKIRRAKPNILLAYTTLPGILCGLTWRLTGAHTCIWNHREAGIDKDYSFTIQRLAARLTPAFITNSQHGAEALVQSFHLKPSQVHVIRNGIPQHQPQKDPAAYRQELGLDERCFIACMVANLRQPKDHATLIKAWKIVASRAAQRNQSAVLVLAGKFMEDYPGLKTLVEELELGKQVIFLGQVSDIAGLLSIANLGVFSSLAEGSPNGVLECMAAGLPIAATDIPGIRESVSSENYPYLSQPGDASQLAEHILQLWQDADTREKLGQTNHQFVEKEFGLERMRQETAKLLLGE